MPAASLPQVVQVDFDADRQPRLYSKSSWGLVMEVISKRVSHLHPQRHLLVGVGHCDVPKELAGVTLLAEDCRFGE